MAKLINTIKPYSPRLNVGSVYAAPAMAPLVVGVNGAIGLAQQNLMRSHSYTLRQMAQSPFAVNNAEYMKRIRDEYNIGDGGFYDTMGIVGGVVGAGVGAFVGSGSLTKQITSKRLETSRAFSNNYKYRLAQNNFFSTNKNIISEYNMNISKYNKLREQMNKVTKNYTEKVKQYLEAKYKVYEYESRILNPTDAQKQIYELSKKTVASFEKTEKAVPIDQIDNYIKIQNNINDTAKNIKTTGDAISKVADASIDTTKVSATVAQNTQDTVKTITKTVSNNAKVVDTGTGTAKAVSKSGGLIPWVGTAIDTASLGMDVLGLIESARADYDNTIDQIISLGLYSNMVAGDIVSIVGDVLSIVGAPTGVLAAVGEVLDIIGTAVSAASGALHGFLVGSTVGHALTPEGTVANALYFKNIYSSWAYRPLTNLVTIGAMTGVPVALGALSRANIPGISNASRWMSSNPFGIYLRSGVTMLATRGLNKLINPVEEKLFGRPEESDDLNFVSYVALVGDLNDNLYGASERKATLMALAKNDPNAQVKALAQAWGAGPEIYNSPSIAEARMAGNIDLGNLGNSLFDTIGEIIIDPQNTSELSLRLANETTVVEFNREIPKHLREDNLRFLNGETISEESMHILYKYTYDVDADGNIITDADGKVKFNIVKDKDGMPELTDIGKKIVRGDDDPTLIRYINAYINEGEEGLNKAIAENTLVSSKGSTSVYKETESSRLAGYIARYITNVLNSDTTETSNLKKLLIEYNNLIKKKRDNTLTDTEKAAAEKAIVVFKQLFKYFDEKSDGSENIKFITKYLSDLDIKMNSKQLLKLYNSYKGFKQQMDLIDDVHRSINNLGALHAYVIKETLPQTFQFLKRLQASASSKENQEFLRDANKIINNNNPDVVLTEQINEVEKRSIERNNTINKINNYGETEDVVVEALKDAPSIEMIDDETQKEIDKFTDNETNITSTLNKINKNEEQLKKYRDRNNLTIYTTKNRTTGETYQYTINDKNANDILKEIEDFEKDENGNNLTNEGIKQKERRLGLKSEAVKKYRAQKDIWSDYMFNKLQNDLYKNAIITSKGITMLLKELSEDLRELMIRFAAKFSNIRKFSNSTITIKKSSVLRNKLRLLTKEELENKKDSIVNKLDDKDVSKHISELSLEELVVLELTTENSELLSKIKQAIDNNTETEEANILTDIFGNNKDKHSSVVRALMAGVPLVDIDTGEDLDLVIDEGRAKFVKTTDRTEANPCIKLNNTVFQNIIRVINNYITQRGLSSVVPSITLFVMDGIESIDKKTWSEAPDKVELLRKIISNMTFYVPNPILGNILNSDELLKKLVENIDKTIDEEYIYIPVNSLTINQLKQYVLQEYMQTDAFKEYRNKILGMYEKLIKQKNNLFEQLEQIEIEGRKGKDREEVIKLLKRQFEEEIASNFNAIRSKDIFKIMLGLLKTNTHSNEEYEKFVINTATLTDQLYDPSIKKINKITKGSSIESKQDNLVNLINDMYATEVIQNLVRTVKDHSIPEEDDVPEEITKSSDSMSEEDIEIMVQGDDDYDYESLSDSLEQEVIALTTTKKDQPFSASTSLDNIEDVESLVEDLSEGASVRAFISGTNLIIKQTTFFIDNSKDAINYTDKRILGKYKDSAEYMFVLKEAFSKIVRNRNRYNILIENVDVKKLTDDELLDLLIDMYKNNKEIIININNTFDTGSKTLQQTNTYVTSHYKQLLVRTIRHYWKFQKENIPEVFKNIDKMTPGDVLKAALTYNNHEWLLKMHKEATDRLNKLIAFRGNIQGRKDLWDAHSMLFTYETNTAMVKSDGTLMVPSYKLKQIAYNNEDYINALQAIVDIAEDNDSNNMFYFIIKSLDKAITEAKRNLKIFKPSEIQDIYKKDNTYYIKYNNKEYTFEDFVELYRLTRTQFMYIAQDRLKNNYDILQEAIVKYELALKYKGTDDNIAENIFINNLITLYKKSNPSASDTDIENKINDYRKLYNFLVNNTSIESMLYLHRFNIDNDNSTIDIIQNPETMIKYYGNKTIQECYEDAKQDPSNLKERFFRNLIHKYKEHLLKEDDLKFLLKNVFFHGAQMLMFKEERAAQRKKETKETKDKKVNRDLELHDYVLEHYKYRKELVDDKGNLDENKLVDLIISEINNSKNVDSTISKFFFWFQERIKIDNYPSYSYIKDSNGDVYISTTEKQKFENYMVNIIDIFLSKKHKQLANYNKTKITLDNTEYQIIKSGKNVLLIVSNNEKKVKQLLIEKYKKQNPDAESVYAVTQDEADYIDKSWQDGKLVYDIPEGDMNNVLPPIVNTDGYHSTSTYFLEDLERFIEVQKELDKQELKNPETNERMSSNDYIALYINRYKKYPVVNTSNNEVSLRDTKTFKDMYRRAKISLAHKKFMEFFEGTNYNPDILSRFFSNEYCDKNKVLDESLVKDLLKQYIGLEDIDDFNSLYNKLIDAIKYMRDNYVIDFNYDETSDTQLLNELTSLTDLIKQQFKYYMSKDKKLQGELVQLYAEKYGLMSVSEHAKLIENKTKILEDHLKANVYNTNEWLKELKSMNKQEVFSKFYRAYVTEKAYKDYKKQNVYNRIINKKVLRNLLEMCTKIDSAVDKKVAIKELFKTLQLSPNLEIDNIIGLYDTVIKPYINSLSAQALSLNSDLQDLEMWTALMLGEPIKKRTKIKLTKEDRYVKNTGETLAHKFASNKDEEYVAERILDALELRITNITHKEYEDILAINNILTTNRYKESTINKVKETFFTKEGRLDLNKAAEYIAKHKKRYPVEIAFALLNESKLNTKYKTPDLNTMSSKDIIDIVSTDILLNNKDFYNKLKEHLKHTPLISGYIDLDNYSTLNSYLQAYKNIASSNENAFNLILTIEKIKLAYLSELKKKALSDDDKKMSTSFYALKFVDTEELGYVSETLKDVRRSQLFDIDSENNIINLVTAPTYEINKFRNTVKAVNRDLSRVLIQDRSKFNNDTFVSKNIVVNDTNIQKITKDLQNETTSILFKNNYTGSARSKLDVDLRKAIDNSSIDLLLEAKATTLEETNGTSPLYYEIRKLFTSVFNKLHKNAFNSHIKFIHRFEIELGIADLINNGKSMQTYYNARNLQSYEVAIELIKAEIDNDPTIVDKEKVITERIQEIESVIKEISNYFKDKGYLIELNESQIKAIIGHIYYRRNKGITDIDKRVETLTEVFTDTYENEQAIKELHKNGGPQKLKEICTNANLSKEERKEALANILHNSSYADLNPEDQKYINDLINLQSTSAAFEMNEHTFFDTWYVVQSKNFNTVEDFYKNIIKYDEQNKILQKHKNDLKKKRTRRTKLKNENEDILKNLHYNESDLNSNFILLENRAKQTDEEIDKLSRNNEYKTNNIIQAIINTHENIKDAYIKRIEQNNRDMIKRGPINTALKLFDDISEEEIETIFKTICEKYYRIKELENSDGYKKYKIYKLLNLKPSGNWAYINKIIEMSEEDIIKFIRKEIPTLKKLDNKKISTILRECRKYYNLSKPVDTSNIDKKVFIDVVKDYSIDTAKTIEYANKHSTIKQHNELFINKFNSMILRINTFTKFLGIKNSDGEPLTFNKINEHTNINDINNILSDIKNLIKNIKTKELPELNKTEESSASKLLGKLNGKYPEQFKKQKFTDNEFILTDNNYSGTVLKYVFIKYNNDIVNKFKELSIEELEGLFNTYKKESEYLKEESSYDEIINKIKNTDNIYTEISNALKNLINSKVSSYDKQLYEKVSTYKNNEKEINNLDKEIIALEEQTASEQTYLKDMNSNLKEGSLYKSWKKFYKEATKGKGTNTALFKKYYLNDKATDEDVVQKVLEMAEQLYPEDKAEEYRNKFKNLTIHNSLIDTLISYFNYCKIIEFKDETKYKDKEFTTKDCILLDVETLPDDMDTKTPYQITLIMIKNGKIENIIDQYFNNQILHYWHEKDGKIIYESKLQEFYRQQEEIWTNSGINKDDCPKMFEELITKLRAQKNSLPAMLAIKHILATNNLPIVTHNGEAFDYPVVTKMYNDYMNRLIHSAYYTTFDIYKPKVIKENLEEKLGHTLAPYEKLINDEYRDELVQKLKELQNRAKEGLSTIREVKSVRKAIVRIVKEIARIDANRRIAEMYREEGIFKDHALINEIFTDENGDYVRLKKEVFKAIKENILELDEADIDNPDSLIHKWFNLVWENMAHNKSKEAEEAERQALIKDIKQRYINIYKQYSDILTNLKENPKRIDRIVNKYINAQIDTVLESLGLKEFDILSSNSIGALYQGTKAALDVIVDAISMLSNKQSKEANEIYLQKIQEQKTQLDKQINDIQDKIIAIDSDINFTDEKINDISSKLTQLQEDLNTRTFNRVINLMENVKKRFMNIKEDDNKLGDIKLQYETISKALDTIVKQIESINERIKFILAHRDSSITPEEFLKLSIDPIVRELDINNLDEHKKYIENRLNDLNKVKSLFDTKDINIDLDLIDAINKYKSLNKQSYEHAVELINKNLNLNLSTDIDNYKKFKEALHEELSKLNLDEKTLRNIYAIKYEYLDKAINNIKLIDQVENIDTMSTDIIKEEINKEIKRCENTIQFLQYDTSKTTTLKELNVYINELNNLITDGTLYSTINDITGELLYEDNIGSTDTDKEAFIQRASETLPETNSEYIDYNESIGAEKVLVDLRKNNHVLAFACLSTDSSHLNIYKKNYDFFVYNKWNHTFATYRSKTNTIEFTYTYTEKGTVLKTHTKKFKWKVEEFVKKILNEDNSNFYKEMGTNIKRVFVPNGDVQLSMLKSMAAYLVHSEKSSTNKNYADQIFNKLKTIHYVDTDKYHIKKDMDLIDITKMSKQMFKYYINMLGTARGSTGVITNIPDIIAGFQRKILGKYKAQDPGKILNLFPEDFNPEGVLDYDTPEDLTGLGEDKDISVNLFEGSEGSEGKVIRIKDNYTITPMFQMHNNPTRAMLISNVILAKATPVGLNNLLFFRQKQPGTIGGHKKDLSDISKYIYNIKNIYLDNEGQLTRDTKVLINDIIFNNADIEKIIQDSEDRKFFYMTKLRVLQELTKVKFDEQSAERQFIFNRFRMYIKNELLYNQYIKDGVLSFIPTTGTYDYNKGYHDKTLLETGFNTKVAYANLPPAYQDTILVDEDFADATGWLESAKTWTGVGFKGAVKKYKGLYRQFGAMFVASADSVAKRGVYGNYLEMAYNKILEVALSKNYDLLPNWSNYTDEQKQKIKTFIENIPTYTSYKDIKDKDAPYYICDNKFITDPYANHDLILNNVLGDYRDIITYKTKEHYDDNDEDKYVRNVTLTMPYNGFTIEDPKVSIEGMSYILGTAYVRMDTMNYATHKQTNTSIEGEDEFAYDVKDTKGSVEGGVMFGLTADVQISGFYRDWKQYLVNSTDTLDLLRGSMNIINNGFSIYDDHINEYLKKLEEYNNQVTLQSLFPVEEEALFKYLVPNEPVPNEHTVIELADAAKYFLKKYTRLNEQFTPKITTYFTKYFLLMDRINKNPKEHYLKLQQISINNAVRNDINDTLGNDNGLIYRTEYARCLGFRAQVVANTALSIGQIKVSHEQLKALLNRNDVRKSMHYKDAQISQELQKKINKVKTMSLQDKIDLVNELHYNGIYETAYDYKDTPYDNFKLINPKYMKINGYNQLVYLDGIEFINPLKQTEITVIAVRSPIQGYGALPIQTIIGTTNHPSAECNNYIYTMIGGDNDGDQAAFAPIDYNQTYNGDLQCMNATRIEYYNNIGKNYVSKDNEKELNIIYKDGRYQLNSQADNLYESSDFAHAFFGKVAGGEDKVRGEKGHYSYAELFIEAYDIFIPNSNTDKQKIIKDITKFNKLKDIVNTTYKEIGFGTLEELDDFNEKRFWLGAVSSIFHHGKVDNEEISGEEYKNKEIVNSLIDKYKETIELLRKLDSILKYLYNKQDNTLYKFINKIRDTNKQYTNPKSDRDLNIRLSTMATIDMAKRIRTSKIGIGQNGTGRKKANMSVRISDFPNMNDGDIKGDKWGRYYHVDPTKVTVYNLLKKNVEHFNLMNILNITNLKEWLKKNFNAENKNAPDRDLIIDWIVEYINNYKAVIDVMPHLYKMIKNEYTYKQLKEFLSTCYIKDNEVVKAIYETMPDTDTKVDYNYIDLVFALIFNFDKDNALDTIKSFGGEMYLFNDEALDKATKHIKYSREYDSYALFIRTNNKNKAHLLSSIFNDISVELLNNDECKSFSFESTKPEDLDSVTYTIVITAPGKDPKNKDIIKNIIQYFKDYYNNLSNYYAMQYIITHVQTRPLLEKMDKDLMQPSISDAKHGALNIDVPDKLKQYSDNMKDYNSRYSKRHIAYSESNTHDNKRDIATGGTVYMKNNDHKFGTDDKDNYIKNNKQDDIALENIRMKYSEARNNALKDTSINKSSLDINIKYAVSSDLYADDWLIPDSSKNKDMEVIMNINKLLTKAQGSFNNLNSDDIDILYTYIEHLEGSQIAFFKVIQSIIDAITIQDYFNTRSKIKLDTHDYIRNSYALIELYFGKIYNNKNKFLLNNMKIYKENPKAKYIIDYFIDINSVDNNLSLLSGDLKTISDEIQNEYQIYDGEIDYYKNLMNGIDIDPNNSKLIAPILSYYKTMLGMPNDVVDTSVADILAELIKSAQTLKEYEEESRKQKESYSKKLFKKEQEQDTREKIIAEETTLEYNKTKEQELEEAAHLNEYEELLKQKKELENRRDELVEQSNGLQEASKVVNDLLEEYGENYTIDEIIKMLTKQKEKYEQDIEDLEEQAIDLAMSLKIGGQVLLMRNGSGEFIKDGKLIPGKKPKIFTMEDLQEFKDAQIMQMDKFQTPARTVLDFFIKEDGSLDYDAAYKFYKEHYFFYRLTLVKHPTTNENEQLLRGLSDFFKKEDTEWNNYTEKQKRNKKNIKKHYENQKFKDVDDLINFFKNTIGVKFTLNKKEYEGIEENFDYEQLKNYYSPTLVEIGIKNKKDFIKICDLIYSDKGYDIGFTNINDVMEATEVAYKPFKMEGLGGKLITLFNSTQKTLMRLSMGFLLRNASDTLYQLATNLYQRKGYGALMQIPQIHRLIKQSEDIFKIYHLLSEERMLTIARVVSDYQSIQTLCDAEVIDKVKIEAYFNRIVNNLDSYIKLLQDDTNPKLQNKIARAKTLQKNVEKLRVLFTYPNFDYSILKEDNTLHAVVKFLSNIEFAEYYKVYDGKYIDGDYIIGLRIDGDIEYNKDEERTAYSKLARMKNKYANNKEGFEAMLFEISAFMNTQAEADFLKEGQYDTLNTMIEHNRGKVLDITGDKEKDLDIIIKEIDKAKADYSNELHTWMSNHIPNLYNEVNERIENMARIVYYIFNRTMYDESFDQSVALSLKSWFNYGQRSQLEFELMYDVPYFSFPIRSINNWIDRILDPRYSILMDDIIDGVYGQYQDKDGQYNNWAKFMMSNGWVPITNKLGIRLGNGAFDVQSLLSQPAQYIKTRRNPLLNAIEKLIDTNDFKQAITQLASIGVISRAANIVSPTKSISFKNGEVQIKPKTLGNSSTIFFEQRIYDTSYEYIGSYSGPYTKYTPYKYRNYNNGRWVKYENIYKDLFTKYGKRRSQNQTPYNIVKTIQWNNIVRAMRSKYKRG